MQLVSWLFAAQALPPNVIAKAKANADISIGCLFVIKGCGQKVGLKCLTFETNYVH